MIITRLKFIAKNNDLVLESSSSDANTKPFVNFITEMYNLKENFVNQKKIEKKQQAKKFTKLKNQIAMLNRLFKKKSQSTSSTIQKKTFIDIKIYNKNFQLYYNYNYFKYDNYVYEIKKIFKSNKILKKVKNPKKHKIVFSTL